MHLYPSIRKWSTRFIFHCSLVYRFNDIQMPGAHLQYAGNMLMTHSSLFLLHSPRLPPSLPPPSFSVPQWRDARLQDWNWFCVALSPPSGFKSSPYSPGATVLLQTLIVFSFASLLPLAFPSAPSIAVYTINLVHSLSHTLTHTAWQEEVA